MLDLFLSLSGEITENHISYFSNIHIQVHDHITVYCLSSVHPFPMTENMKCTCGASPVHENLVTDGQYSIYITQLYIFVYICNKITDSL